MSLQYSGSDFPIRRAISDLAETYEEADWKQRNELQRKALEAVFHEQLSAACAALRMTNRYKLHQLQIDLHISFAEHITKKIMEANNLLTIRLLVGQFEKWERETIGYLG